MGYAVQSNTTARPLLFLLVLASDHISPATGLAPTVTLSKNGGSFAAPSGAVTEVGNGWYQVAANASDNATLGPLLLHATADTADPVDEVYEVVAYDPGDAQRLGLAALPAAGTLLVKPAVTLAAADVSGSLDVGLSDEQVSALQTALASGLGPAVATALLASSIDGVLLSKVLQILLSSAAAKTALNGYTLTLLAQDGATPVAALTFNPLVPGLITGAVIY